MNRHWVVGLRHKKMESTVQYTTSSSSGVLTAVPVFYRTCDACFEKDKPGMFSTTLLYKALVIVGSRGVLSAWRCLENHVTFTEAFCFFRGYAPLRKS